MLPIDRASSTGLAVKRDRSPVLFFLLVFALSVPIWLVTSLGHIQLLPGLPLSSVMVVCPLAASLILVVWERGSSGVTAHLRRALDFKLIKNKIWYAPILLLMPATAVLAYLTMRVLDLPLPAATLSISNVPALFLLLFFAALARSWAGRVTL
jgi:uncharacterized protein